MVIPMDIYKMLVYKSEQYDKMLELAKKHAPALDAAPEPRLPSLDPNSVDKGGKKGFGSSKRRDDDDDDDDDGDPGYPTIRMKKGGKYQAEEKIPEEELGTDVTVCPWCKMNQKHTPG